MELKDTVTCEKDLFIYRFSGLYQYKPFNPENKIQWNGSNIYLGYIIRYLTSDKINYPERMGLYATFFLSKTGKNINFGTETHIEVDNFDREKIYLNKSFVKAVELLRRCGFFNVEYSSKRR